MALCRLLLAAPDMLLLDEPTNHLDAESVAWLERYLEKYTGTVVAVTHDRYFLDNVAGWILELDRTRGLPFKGNYIALARAEAAAARARGAARGCAAAHDRARARVGARVAQGRRSKAPCPPNRYEALLAEETSVKVDHVEIHIPAGPRLGDVVLETDDLRKGYGDRLLIEDLEFTLPPGGHRRRRSARTAPARRPCSA